MVYFYCLPNERNANSAAGRQHWNCCWSGCVKYVHLSLRFQQYPDFSVGMKLPQHA